MASSTRKNRQWNLTQVGAKRAIALLTGSETGTPAWERVRIAHLDSGYTEHPVFGTWDGNTGPFLVPLGNNYVDKRTRPNDPVANVGMAAGHGTRTSSVLAGDLQGTDDGRRFGTRVGVAPGVPVIPYRVTNVNILLQKKVVNRLADAIVDASKPEKNVQVISISLGSPVLFSKRLGRAIDTAYERGVIVVAAGGQVVDAVTYPGKFSRTIGVGGIERTRKIYWHYPEKMLDRIDVWAPADEIFRADTGLEDDDKTLRYHYEKLGDGTSYATVHVAAAAAFWLEHNWDEINSAYMETDKKWRRVEAFRHLLRTTGSTVNLGGRRPGPSRRPHPPLDTKILNIAALMRKPLPPASMFRMKRLAADEVV